MHPSIAHLDPQAISKLHQVFASLSLDMAAPTLDHLGIPDAHAATFRAAVRGALAELWQGETTPEREAHMIGVVFDALERLLGPHGADEVKANLVDAFLDQAHDAQMFLWEQVATFGGREEDPPKLPVLLRRLRSTAAPEVPHTHHEHTPQTAYDRALLERYGYATDPTEDELSPMPQLELAAARVTFLRGLRKAAGAAEDPDAEVDELYRWGKVACEPLGMPSEMLERPTFLHKPRWQPA